MWRWLLLAVFLSFVINWFDWKYLYSNFLENKTKQYDLIIGILSSRSNFQQREAIRRTWLSILNNSSNLNNYKVKAWFIVGDHECSIPIEYRLNSYDCQLWETNVSIIKNTKEFSTGKINAHDCISELCNVHQGFSFQVNYPIIIKKLGVLSEAIPSKSSIKVTLLNGPLQEVVIKTTINAEGFNNNINGFLYRPVTPYLLPKGFEGVLLVEGVLSRSVSSSIEWNNGSGLITFQRIYKTAEDSNTVEFDDKYQAASSMIFTISNQKDFVDLYINRENVTTKWQKLLHSVNQSLQEELQKSNDIFLVDVMDVYRNLPVKLLKFLHGLATNYKFSSLLKTDDDCFIHLSKVINELLNLKHKFGKNWWWSRFRHNWIVNYFGKWKDFNYASAVYPAFPCGGGYVLSSDVVKWIALNENALYPYQGEDVSMGIWLSAIRLQKYEDNRWNCEEGCQENSFNRVQLSIEDMYKIWNTSVLCGNICHC